MDDDAEQVEMEEEPAGGCFPWILALSGGGGAVSVEAPEVGAAAPRVSPSRPLTGGGVEEGGPESVKTQGFWHLGCEMPMFSYAKRPQGTPLAPPLWHGAT